MNSFLIYMKLQGLSEKTIAEHSRNFNKYKNLGGDLKWDEQKTVDFIKENYAEGSSQKSITSTLSKYRHYKGKTTETIRQFLSEANADASLLQRQKNDKLRKIYPILTLSKC